MIFFILTEIMSSTITSTIYCVCNYQKNILLIFFVHNLTIAQCHISFSVKGLKAFPSTWRSSTFSLNNAGRDA